LQKAVITDINTTLETIEAYIYQQALTFA